MKRTILTPAALAPAALAELKQWLGISTAPDDAPLTALLRLALDTCEDFTGTMPLQATCEEVLPVSSEWRTLTTRPVQAIALVEGIPAEGARFTLPSTGFALELDADGGARVRVISPGAAGRIAVRFVAGLAPDWASLPEALRHGAIRLAAHQHRQREDGAAAPLPPAAVAALWRPWRRVRLT
ncbi:MAG: head-tail connector protein [Novosphingobium sp.]